ncbi:MAG: heme-binding beta-barrel domain-containing protein [Lawsonella clevelandensis]
MTDTTTPRDDAPLTGNEAITKAEEVPPLPPASTSPPSKACPLPTTPPTCATADIHEGLLALLPLVGVWRGRPSGNYPEATPSEEEAKSEQGDFAFGQQLIVSHNGENYLCWDLAPGDWTGRLRHQPGCARDRLLAH